MRKSTKTKALAALLALAMALLLTACGHEHTWTDATCTAPKTCSECGETEGEALGHSWADATCTAPKTCSVCKETEGDTLPHTWEEATCSAPKTCSECGETEGEALPHTLTEANYQSPAVCTVCGAEVGDPLEADCEKYPVPFMEQGVTYDCIMGSSPEQDADVDAHVTLLDTKRFDSDEEHPAVEGYEYRTADIEMECYGDTMWKYGYWYGYIYGDYYDNIGNESEEDESVGWNDGDLAFTCNYNGIVWEDCWMHLDQGETTWDEDAKSGTMIFSFTMCIPVDYDGVIIGLHDPRIEIKEDTYLADLYEDGHFVLFRMA